MVRFFARRGCCEPQTGALLLVTVRIGWRNGGSRKDAKTQREDPGLGLVELCYGFLIFFASLRLERSGRETDGLSSTALAIRLVH
jgi:hypothetical protein